MWRNWSDRKVTSVDKYQDLLARSQVKATPVVSDTNDWKALYVEEPSSADAVCEQNSQYCSDSTKFRDAVRWIRVSWKMQVQAHFSRWRRVENHEHTVLNRLSWWLQNSSAAEVFWTRYRRQDDENVFQRLQLLDVRIYRLIRDHLITATQPQLQTTMDANVPVVVRPAFHSAPLASLQTPPALKRSSRQFPSDI